MNKILIFIVVLFSLIVAYFSLQKDTTAMLTTRYYGANASEVEIQVTQKLEEELMQIDEIKDIRSYSRAGLSVIYIDLYNKYRNLQVVYDKIRRRINLAIPILPSGVVPVLDEEYSEIFPFMVIVKGDDFSYKELKDIADKARRTFLKLSDSSKVVMVGNLSQVVYLTYYNPAQYGLSTDKLSQYLMNTNIVTNDSDVEVRGNNIIISMDENFISEDDLKKTQILIDGKNIALGDIFDVKLAYENPPRAIVQSNGKKAIVLAISVKKGGSKFFLKQQIEKSIKQLNAELLIGIDLKLVKDKLYALKITLPFGDDIYKTKKTVDEIEKQMGAKNVLSYIGISPMRYKKNLDPDIEKSNIATILTNSKSAIEKAQKFCDKNLIQTSNQNSSHIEITFKGLPSFALDNAFKKMGKVLKMENNWGKRVPLIKINLNKAQMARLGISAQDVAQAVKSAYDGYKISSFYDGRNKVDILYRMNDKMRQNIENIDSVMLYSPIIKQNFPLSEIANINLEFQYPEIYRHNNERAVTVKIYYSGLKINALLKIKQLIKKFNLQAV